MYLQKKKNRKSAWLISLFLLSVVLLFSSCSEDDDGYGTGNGGGSGNPGANEVFLQSSSFSPASKTVTAGTTVKWINKANATHNVISGPQGSPSGLFNSGDFGLNGEFTHTFNQPGTFVYYCSHHGGMTGTIIVQ